MSCPELLSKGSGIAAKRSTPMPGFSQLALSILDKFTTLDIFLRRLDTLLS
jgi:hypothetical protein